MPPPEPTSVSFATSDGTLEVRYGGAMIGGIVETCKQLKATHFVMPEDDQFGVFDVRKAQKGIPLPGDWLLPAPSRVFPTRDAAEMYALMMRGK